MPGPTMEELSAELDAMDEEINARPSGRPAHLDHLFEGREDDIGTDGRPRAARDAAGTSHLDRSMAMTDEERERAAVAASTPQSETDALGMGGGFSSLMSGIGAGFRGAGGLIKDAFGGLGYASRIGTRLPKATALTLWSQMTQPEWEQAKWGELGQTINVSKGDYEQNAEAMGQPIAGRDPAQQKRLDMYRKGTF